MKRKTIKILIFFSSIALAGIIFSQIYWVKEAVELRNDQFDYSVRIAAKSVVNQFLDKKNDSVFREHLKLVSCRKLRVEVTDIVQPIILDSLLQGELKCMHLYDDYCYGIYNKQNQKFVAGEHKLHETNIVMSPYQFSLSSLYRPGDYYLGIYFPNKTSILFKQMWVMLVFSSIFMLVLISSFIFVIHTILRQKKLSEMKTDFINNLTHEFKTPIATTSLAAEMLIKEDIMDNPSKVYKYANVILDESTRLQSQVEQILQIATVEKGSFKLKLKKTNIHLLLDGVVGSFELMVKKNNVKLTTEFIADDYMLYIDRVHITNVFYNLIDNAIKYSPERPEISIETKNIKSYIVVSIKDNGVGINKEFQKDIFKNLFRIPTGNLHEVRGFGLGLYYSKEVVESCGGHIKLLSTAGEGSTFEVFLPLKDMKK